MVTMVTHVGFEILSATRMHVHFRAQSLNIHTHDFGEIIDFLCVLFYGWMEGRAWCFQSVF